MGGMGYNPNADSTKTGARGGRGTSSTPESRSGSRSSGGGPNVPDGVWNMPMADELRGQVGAAMDAKTRSEQISREMENATGNEDEYQMLLDSQVEGRGGIDDNWHQAGQATAESYARRGLGGSGMSSGDQYEVAMKRNDAVGDAVLRARTAAIAQQRADLGQEQQALVGAQTSDINAQRLAMEEQAYRDQILAEAVGALAQTGVQYGTEAQRKKDEAEAAAKKAGG